MKWAKQKGFTIVELLIVIIVIAILAAITIVAYNGVQRRASSASIASSLAQWDKIMKLYQAETGAYPALTASLSPTGCAPFLGRMQSEFPDSSGCRNAFDSGMIASIKQIVGEVPAGKLSDFGIANYPGIRYNAATSPKSLDYLQSGNKCINNDTSTLYDSASDVALCRRSLP